MTHIIKFHQNYILIALMVLLGSMQLTYGQVTGPTSVQENSTHTYQFSNGQSYPANWIISGGTLLSSWNSGTTYYVSAKWDGGMSNGTVVFTSTNNYLYVTIASSTPSTPSTPTIQSSNCGNTVLARGNPPSGVTWYWQSSSSGTSTSNSASTITKTSSGTQYLRARNNSSGTWSTSSSNKSYTVSQSSTWYQDQDGDGLGDSNNTQNACSQPLNYVSNDTDQCPTESGTAANNGCPLGASNNQNYIHTISPRIASTDASIETLNDAEKIESITYFDGLGRSMQSIGIRAGGNSEDIIAHIGYDNYGRQTKEYLPYTLGNNHGTYKTDALAATNTYYDASKYEPDFPSVALNDINAYSEKELEASPLSRVLKQAAPGKDWKLGNNHEIEFDYLSNITNEVRQYDVSLSFANNTYTPTLIIGTLYYNANELYKSITKDENHDGSASKAHTIEEFKDKQGRVVLKRTYGTSKVGGVTQTNVAHDTHYVYDDYGNLTYVLPPKAMDLINPNNLESTINSTAVVNTGNNLSLNATHAVILSDGFIAHSGSTFTAIIEDSQAVLDELGYQYKYDNRNRLVEKKIPGKDWGYIVYDKLDRPALTQDANLRAQNKWLFTKYDAFGRVAYTGEMTKNISRTALQTDVSNTASQYVIKSSAITIDNTTIYYNNSAYPINDITELYTINYYDDYGFDKATSLNLPSSHNLQTIINHDDTNKGLTKGLATGSKVRVLETDNWITTVTGYDVKGRPIYIASDNPYLGTTDIVKSTLDFVGAVDKTETEHTKGSTNVITEDLFTYDHVGRLKKQTQELNNTIEILVENTYDDLGQLESKGVGGTGVNRLQDVDYTYNVRGWLKQINNPTNLGTDLFGFKLNYNTVDHSGTKLYNGNIAEAEWKTQNDNMLRHYTYSYDALNRITVGSYNNATSTEPGWFNVSNITYDKNGNLLSLNRTKKGTSSAGAASDYLTYFYDAGNKLLKVEEQYDGAGSFEDGINTGDDYEYDINGNMITDHNKGIGTTVADQITYNHLNLPTNIGINKGSNIGNISYIYDATGIKLKKEVSTGTTTEYAGNYVYENSSLKFFNHPEGYIEPKDENNLSLGYNYVYQYKDHLGNVRLSYMDSNNNGSVTASEILEENNYYPFGLKHIGYNNGGTAFANPALKYKFGGKEYQDELDLNSYDFGARFYDPAVGKWFTPDAFAEKYLSTSPYTYALDNPIIYIDPDGNQVELCCNWEKIIDAINLSIGGSVGIGLKAKVTKHFSAGLGATVVDADYSISDDRLKLKFLGLNGNLTVGKNFINAKGSVFVSTLEVENFNNLFDGNLPDFKSFTFLGAEGKAKIYKAVDAKGKAWVIKRDSNGNWTVLDSDGTISADGVFERSDIAAEFKLGVKLKFGIDLGKLWDGIMDNDSEAEEDTSSNEDSEARSAGFTNLISNLGSLQEGTYVWDGENWVLK